MYAPAPNGILDDNGRLLPEVLAARRRGVWFDVGNGTTGHITWEQAEQAIQQGFIPHTISTDWTPRGPQSARTQRLRLWANELSQHDV
jgi:predicted amidohydrolase